MNATELKQYLQNGGFDARFAYIYGEGAVDAQKKRYAKAIDSFAEIYGMRDDVALYSVAGRSELSGNHTDHNHGCVIAGSIDLDIIAVASGTSDTLIRVKSEGYDEDVVNIAEFTAPRQEWMEKSTALVAGMAKAFSDKGLKTGGFVAYTTSNVLKGSGISSSAAFEDMIGNILNYIYNDGRVDNVEIAKMAQYAENVFFGKPCGLMDQVACAVGGIVAIDFKDPTKPMIEKLNFDITKAGYNLCITNTGGNHADLTDDYASVPTEMKAVARQFGKEVLRDVEEKDVLSSVSSLRKTVGDRAILRALHFFAENKRVSAQKEALLKGDVDSYLALVKESGRSSFCYLQNVFTTKNVAEQGVSLALCLTETLLKDKKSAWRVHGGGFAGTIQAYVPVDFVEEYRKAMDEALGEGKCMVLRIRPVGAVKI